MRLDTFLAVRFLREGRAQTLLLIGGAAVGVAVIVFISSIIDAVSRTVIRQTLDALPHVVVRMPERTVRPPDEDGALARVERPAQRPRSVESWRTVLPELRALPHVAGATPVANGPGLAFRGSASRAVSLIGIDPDTYPTVILVEKSIVRGTLKVGSDDVVLGVELAKDLGAGVGDRVRLAGAETPARTMNVIGLIDVGNRDINRRWALVSLRSAQNLLDLPGGATELDVRTDNLWLADEVAASAAARTGLVADSWTVTNGQLRIAVESQARSADMIKAFIILAVAMGIASVLIVSVVQRSKQIGILRAMGMGRSAVLRVFLLQGMAVGLIGAIIGCSVGAGLVLMFQEGVRNPDGTPIYTMELPASLFIASTLLAVTTGLAAAVFPARRAARLDPAEAIRHE